MNTDDLQAILTQVKTGELSETDAATRIQNLSYEDIGYARVDHGRASRQGLPEVIFGQGKTPEQVCGIFEKLIARSPNALITRTTPEVFGQVRNIHTYADWHESAKMIRVIRDTTDLGISEISICTAGTNDIPVAEQAALTAEPMAN